jgi:hypothetical protein
MVSLLCAFITDWPPCRSSVGPFSFPNLNDGFGLFSQNAALKFPKCIDCNGSAATAFMLPLQDLELMHHYSTVTSLTFASLTPMGFEKVWQDVVPVEARSHLFLMHTVLATAALHSAHLKPTESSRYVYIARDYHGKAMALFRSNVSEVTQGNGSAVLAFAFLLVIFCLGSSFIPNVPSPTDPIDSFFEALSALRGFWQLLPTVRPVAGESPVAGWVQQSRKLYSIPPDSDVFEALAALDAVNETSVTEEAEKDVYRSGIRLLRKFFSDVPLYPTTWEVIFTWPLAITDEYATYLASRQPMALLILAYWCVPIHHAPHRWFLSQWGERIIRQIADILGPQWLFALEWPLSEIGCKQDPDLISTSLLKDIATELVTEIDNGIDNGIDIGLNVACKV